MNKKLITTLLLFVFLFSSVTITHASFKDDYQISPEAKAAVAYVEENKMMVGYNQLFSPKKNLTRGEVAKILTVALGLVAPDEVLSPLVETPFIDMKNHWANPYVEKLRAYNPSLITGYPTKTFKLDNQLRKDEFIKLLVVQPFRLSNKKSEKRMKSNFNSHLM